MFLLGLIFLCSVVLSGVVFYSIYLGSEIIRSLAFVSGSKFYGLGCANAACSMALMLLVDLLACAYRTHISIFGSIWDAGN